MRSNLNASSSGRPEIRSAWVLTDGKAGDEQPCIGVAEALGVPYELRRVAPRPPFVWLMPWGPIDPREAPTVAGSPLRPPLPDVVIASGRRAVPYARHLRRAGVFTVFLKDPVAGTSVADLIWVQAHDRLRGDNVLVTPTPPHRFSADRLAAARVAPLPEIARLARPRVAVLVGGGSRHHRFTAEDIHRFVAGLEQLAGTGASLMITPSRRTPRALAQALAPLAATGRHLLWTGSGDNPLVQYLAHADAVVATADSTNMIGEATVTGRPIHVFRPSGGHAKFDHFLGDLRRLGAVHPFPGPLETTTYDPMNTTPVIAAAIRAAFAARGTATGRV